MQEFDKIKAFRPQLKRSLNKAFGFSVEKPSLSFSQCMTAQFRKTIGSIFSNSKMTYSTMLEGHIENTLTRAALCESDYLIAAQDTTFYNYTSHKALDGIGKIGTKKSKNCGLAQHNTLLMNEKGVALGLIDQQYWTRDGKCDILSTEKESIKWIKGLQAVNTHLKSLNKQVVLVQDREADIFDFFKEKRESNIKLLVRVCQPRNLEIVSTGEICNLEKIRTKLPIYGEYEIEIRVNNKDIRLRMQVRASAVNVRPNKDLSIKKHQIEGLSLVIAEEIERIDVATGQIIVNEDEKALWYLLTDLPILELQDVLRVVKFYALRWGVEVFHYTMKSGALNVEKLQFDDVTTLINALAFYSIVAWQLLSLTLLVRTCPNASATTLYDKKQITVLENVTNKPIKTISQYILALGSLIGFTTSKKQPLPGVKVMAKAIECFHFIMLGAKSDKSKE